MSKPIDENKFHKTSNTDVQPRSGIERLVKNKVAKAREPFMSDRINLKEQNKRRILECVGSDIINGISTGRLVRETGLSRDTIYDLGLELIEEGLTTKHGKQGNYVLTSRVVYSDHRFLARKFSEEIMWMVMHDPAFRFQYFCVDNKFGSDRLAKRKNHLINQNYTFFHDNPDAKSEMDAILIYEFANRIGAIVTYLIINAFQFYSKATINVGKRKIPIVGSIDKLILDWLDAALRPYMLLNEFHKFIGRERTSIFGEEILRRTKEPELVPPPSPKIINNPKSKSRELRRWSFYQTQESEYKRLNKAFAAVYPDFFKHAEGIRKKLPKEIEKRLTLAEKKWNIIKDGKFYRELQNKRKQKNAKK
jgi:hypothetical protein